MTILITAGNTDAHAALVHGMHSDRKRVFVDWLGWDVPHDGVEERDEFDDENAVYLIVEGRDRRHLGSVRLLRTDGPHILGDLFPQLCDGPVPRSPRIREATRLCVSPDCPREERPAVRRTLVCALVEYGLLVGLEGFTMLTDVSFLSRVAATGWRCDMLGLPRPHAGQMLGALQVHLDRDTIPALRRAGIYLDAAIEVDPARRLAA